MFGMLKNIDRGHLSFPLLTQAQEFV